MARNPFISETYVKENTTINLNVETKFIRVSVIDAQTIHIQDAIGTKLFKKIESLLPSDITNVENEIYKTLLDDYIAPALLQWTIVECIPLVRFKITNKSITADGSDNSNPSDLDEVKYLIQKYSNKAEFYTQRLINFLIQNSNVYTEYTTNNNFDEMIPSSTSYFSGTFFPDTHLIMNSKNDKGDKY